MYLVTIEAITPAGQTALSDSKKRQNVRYRIERALSQQARVGRNLVVVNFKQTPIWDPSIHAADLHITVVTTKENLSRNEPIWGDCIWMCVGGGEKNDKSLVRHAKMKNWLCPWNENLYSQGISQIRICIETVRGNSVRRFVHTYSSGNLYA